MRSLIVEDDYITSQVMQEIILSYGESEIVENGSDAIAKFKNAIAENNPFDIIFLDIMMPEMDGQKVLESIRNIEKENNIQGLDSCKIIMTTALDDFENIKKAFINQAEGYVVKPLDKEKISKVLKDLGMIDI
jgi:two-component system chemotaxis response regulator CheY